jgi:PhzF family phenazine biosynthesis protein
VVILPPDHAFSDSTLRKIAAEFNLSETAFVIPSHTAQPFTDPESVSFQLRWFTPVLEVRLCGHATIASAKVLFSNTTLVPPSVKTLQFSTLSGELLAKRVTGDEGDKFELEFPAGNSEEVEDEFVGRVTALVHLAVGNSPAIKEVRRGVGDSFKPFVLVSLEESFDLETAKVNGTIFVSG